jgi:hypothetical protein
VDAGGGIIGAGVHPIRDGCEYAGGQEELGFNAD